MKSKILLLTFSVVCLQMSAQISFENTYTVQVDYTRLMAIYLEHAGTKYFLKDSTGFELYNLDHTLYKTITYPPDTFLGITNAFFYYITEDLFDNDSSTIEYGLYRFSQFNQTLFYSKILDENNSVLFYSDSLQFGGTLGLQLNSAPYMDQKFIVQTEEGSKMILTDRLNTRNYVYSLPGNIYTPCPCDGSQAMNVHGYSGGKSILSNYPNPYSGKTTIEYDLPNGIHEGELVIYTSGGDVIKRYHITDAFRTLEFDSGFLPSGNYFYQLVIPGGFSQAKKMMVVK